MFVHIAGMYCNTSLLMLNNKNYKSQASSTNLLRQSHEHSDKYQIILKF